MTNLPEGVFGDVTFEDFIIFDVVNLVTVHPSIILQSKERLQQLAIGYCRLEEFPWEILPQLIRLNSLDLHGNYITTLPPLQSPTLQYFDFRFNFIDALEAGWSTPNLLGVWFGECKYVLLLVLDPPHEYLKNILFSL